MKRGNARERAGTCAHGAGEDDQRQNESTRLFALSATHRDLGFQGVELGGFAPHPNPDDMPHQEQRRAGVMATITFDTQEKAVTLTFRTSGDVGGHISISQGGRNREVIEAKGGELHSLPAVRTRVGRTGDADTDN